MAWGVLVHHRAADPTLPPVIESSTGGSLASFIRHLSSLFTKIHQVCAGNTIPPHHLASLCVLTRRLHCTQENESDPKTAKSLTCYVWDDLERYYLVDVLTRTLLAHQPNGDDRGASSPDSISYDDTLAVLMCLMTNSSGWLQLPQQLVPPASPMPSSSSSSFSKTTKTLLFSPWSPAGTSATTSAPSPPASPYSPTSFVPASPYPPSEATASVEAAAASHEEARDQPTAGEAPAAPDEASPAAVADAAGGGAECSDPAVRGRGRGRGAGSARGGRGRGRGAAKAYDGDRASPSSTAPTRPNSTILLPAPTDVSL